MVEGACAREWPWPGTLNILSIFVTLETFQLLSGWLKEFVIQSPGAHPNIPSIFVTLETSQFLQNFLFPDFVGTNAELPGQNLKDVM